MFKKIFRIGNVVMLFGLLLITFCAYIEVTIPNGNAPGGVLGNILIRYLLKDLGVGLVISGFVNFIIERGGFSDDYSKIVADVMTKDSYLNLLNRNKMLEMLYKLQARIVFGEKNEDLSNYFYVVQNEMIDLLGRYYYDECYVRVECFIEGNIIRKIMKKRMVIINPRMDGKRSKYVTIPFSTEMVSITGYDDKELLKINYFKINSNDYTNDAKSKLLHKRISDRKLEDYNVGFYGSYEVECKKSCIVEMETETIVPKTDNIFSNRLTQPCRSYNMIFHLHNNDYEIEAVSFCFMENHKNKVVDYKCDLSIEVRFTDWMLPGNGVVIVINPKKVENISYQRTV